MKSWENIFICWLVAFPYVYWKGSYEGVKVHWLWMGSVPLFLLWLFPLRDKIAKLINKTDIFYLLWIITLTVSSLKGIHPIDSVLGGSYRHQGVIFFLSLWVIWKTVQLLSKEKKEKLKKWILWGAIIQSAIVIIQKTVFFLIPTSIVTINGRPIGTIGEPNAVGGFLVMGSAFIPSKSKKTYFLQLLFLAAIFITESRTALFAFLFIFLLKLFNQKKKRLTTKIIAPAILVSAVIITSILLTTSLRMPSRFENRMVYASIAARLIKERPYLGYGAETGEVLFDRSYKEAEMPLVGLIIDRTHNLFLDVTLWSGLIGLSFFITWLTTVYRTYH